MPVSLDVLPILMDDSLAAYCHRLLVITVTATGDEENSKSIMLVDTLSTENTSSKC